MSGQKYWHLIGRNDCYSIYVEAHDGTVSVLCPDGWMGSALPQGQN